MVKREVHDKLIEALKKEIIKQYGSNYLASPNYGKIIDYINSHDAPLACYIFARNKKLINYLIRQIGFGVGCINDTLIHLSSSYLGFGGFKESGLGSYHGKAGFYTFSHTKSIIDKKLWIDLPMRYSPYSKRKDRIIHKFLK